MKTRYSLPILVAFIALGVWLYGRGHDSPGRAGSGGIGSPILVELFTSEGCSSCPPADQLLEKLDAQPVSGAQIIVLSEHVDYWNHDGWTDPYSNAAFSERQHGYGSRFQLDSVYTPQMVVDGSSEFVGNSFSQARQAFEKAQSHPKVSLYISDLQMNDRKLRAHLASDALPAGTRKADMVLVIALSHADSQVARGENAGRHLTHVAVVRDLSVVGPRRAASLQQGRFHRAGPRRFSQQSSRRRVSSGRWTRPYTRRCSVDAGPLMQNGSRCDLSISSAGLHNCVPRS